MDEGRRTSMAVIPDDNVHLATNIRDVLNAAGGSVGNNVISFFQPDAKINKWSRYKPVSHSKLFNLTDNDFKWVNFGISNDYIGSSARTPKSLMDEAASGKDFYPYIPPRGGEDSPFRISDFRGYDTNAEPPYVTECPNSIESQVFPANMHYSVYVSNSPNGFKMTEMASFVGSVLGVIWTNDDSSYYFFRYTKEEEITEGLEMTLSLPNPGIYKFLAVWTNVDFLPGETDISSMAETFIPVPDSYRCVEASIKEVWGVVNVSWDALNHLEFYNSNKCISGFARTYPLITLTFPNGATPSCQYRLGIYIRATLDGSTYGRTWWYDDQYISHGGGSSESSEYFVNIPDQINLEVLLGALYDPYMTAEEITVRLEIERVDGQGFLGLDNNEEYNVTIY